MPFDGLSQNAYAKKLISEYQQAGISPNDVFVQSCKLAGLHYWIKHHPDFAKQALYLDNGYEQLK